MKQKGSGELELIQKRNGKVIKKLKFYRDNEKGCVKDEDGKVTKINRKL
jgi:hypothetical protein